MNELITKLGQIARIIDSKAWDEKDPYFKLWSNRRRKSQEDARNAIKILCEPTPEMIKAGYCGLSKGVDTDLVKPAGVSGCYNAMLDQMLE